LTQSSTEEPHLEEAAKLKLHGVFPAFMDRRIRKLIELLHICLRKRESFTECEIERR
jgi:hypothetical protein